MSGLGGGAHTLVATVSAASMFVRQAPLGSAACSLLALHMGASSCKGWGTCLLKWLLVPPLRMQRAVCVRCCSVHELNGRTCVLHNGRHSLTPAQKVYVFTHARSPTLNKWRMEVLTRAPGGTAYTYYRYTEGKAQPVVLQFTGKPVTLGADLLNLGVDR